MNCCNKYGQAVCTFIVEGQCPCGVIGVLMVYVPRNVFVGRDRIKAMCAKWPWVKSTEAARKRNEENLRLVGPVEMKPPANIEAEEAPANADSLI